MAAGRTASIVLVFEGLTPSDTGQEVDLSIDPAGDLLTVNAGGDGLLVSTGATWAGRSAAIAAAWNGATATLVLPAGVNLNLTLEAGGDILTETGGSIVAEA